MAGQKQVVEKIHGRIYRLRGDCQCPGRGVERREAQGRLFPWYWHYALDKGHMNDVEWLKRVMEKLRNMCEGRQPVAPGCEGVVSLAKEEDCWSTVKLSGEIVEGADVEVRKLVLYYKELPQGYLPSDGIVPHFYWEGTIRVIPAELYV